MPVDHETAVCYSQRMLDPFHGMMSVVETAHADAVSCDGVHWTLFIHWEPEEGTPDDQDGLLVQSPDIRFGSWNARDGLKRAPVRSTTDYGRLQCEGGELVHLLERLAERVPFPARDCYELWLLDEVDGLPLALVGSACKEKELRQSPPAGWNAGIRAQNFFAQKGRAPDLIEKLTDQVNAASGCRMAMQWFLR
ncbi:MAG TPA: hypothetical protein EYH03_04525, partial [Chromatiales bacterium]|nr:hypothetical protein [Chromatiales bacterium]